MAKVIYPVHVIDELKAEFQKPLETKYQLAYLASRLRNLIIPQLARAR